MGESAHVSHVEVFGEGGRIAEVGENDVTIPEKIIHRPSTGSGQAEYAEYAEEDQGFGVWDLGNPAVTTSI